MVRSFSLHKITSCTKFMNLFPLQVKPSVIWKFTEAGGRKTFLLVLSSTLGFIVSQIGTGLWLRKWSADKPNINGTIDADVVHLRLGVYGVMGVVQGGFEVKDTFYFKVNWLSRYHLTVHT